MSFSIPRSFRLAGVYCGLKRNATKLDLTLVVSDIPAVAAGVYTTNLVFAAPVGLDRARTPGSGFRTVVINSGNANACTGVRGDADAARMAELGAQACGAEGKQALVMSTGIIGEFLKMDKIEAGIQAASAKLATDEDALVDAARGMLTTDTCHKLASRTVALSGGRQATITGMAKGAAMIGPRMGTMLSLIMTDAPLEPATAQAALSGSVNDTFNCISVDGHMSTNDTVLLVANGAVGGAPLAGAELAAFQQSLAEVCGDLARAIPNDGEGCTHLVTIDVTDCADRASAHKIAKTVAESMLVKAAIAGADPNWGRIVSAAGYANIPFNPKGVNLRVNGTLLYERGAPVPFDAATVSQSIKNSRDTSIELEFSEGGGKIRFWTTDLTAEYVRLNADYHT